MPRCRNIIVEQAQKLTEELPKNFGREAAKLVVHKVEKRDRPSRTLSNRDKFSTESAEMLSYYSNTVSVEAIIS